MNKKGAKGSRARAMGSISSKIQTNIGASKRAGSGGPQTGKRGGLKPHSSVGTGGLRTSIGAIRGSGKTTGAVRGRPRHKSVSLQDKSVLVELQALSEAHTPNALKADIVEGVTKLLPNVKGATPRRTSEAGHPVAALEC